MITLLYNALCDNANKAHLVEVLDHITPSFVNALQSHTQTIMNFNLPFVMPTNSTLTSVSVSLVAASIKLLVTSRFNTGCY